MTRFGIVVASGGLVVIIGFGWGFRDTLSSWFAGESPQVEESHTHEAGDIAYWTCPMHPSVKAEEAGPCPICGMDLTPVPVARKVKESSPAEASSERPQGMPGFITLTAWQQQLIGVTAETVERRSLDATLRTVGRVDYDETRLTDVNLKVTGWIRKLYVDFTGRPVKQGEPLFTLYSPELLSTQKEYLLAHAAVNRLENAAGEVGDAEAQSEVRKEAIVRSQTVLESARQRLLLWDLNEKQIQQLVKDGKPKTTVTVYAPAAGFVVQKMAVEGMFVQPGMRLYRIGSLDAVWVIADVYEYEIAAVHVGQEAIISLSYQPNKTFEGLVDYIYPDLNPKTRTAKIRLKVPNPLLELRPEMFVDVTLETDPGDRLAVPESAVLFSGKRRVVFVDLGGGRFQPREVRLGVLMGDHYQVQEGLEEGDRVVTSANFLLDSESRLKNVMAAMVSDIPPVEE